jgi:hypothetical protein
VDAAKGAGVSARLVLERGILPEQVAASVLEAARASDAGLIALASVSGTLAALVVGSVAREVFRAGEYPVWVCGPRLLADAAKARQHHGSHRRFSVASSRVF